MGHGFTASHLGADPPLIPRKIQPGWEVVKRWTGPILVGLEISGSISAGDAHHVAWRRMHYRYAFTEEFHQMKRLISARLTRLPDPIDLPMGMAVVCLAHAT